MKKITYKEKKWQDMVFPCCNKRLPAPLDLVDTVICSCGKSFSPKDIINYNLYNIDLFKEIFNEKRASYNSTCQLCCDKTLTIFFEKLLKDNSILRNALDMACDRISDSPQKYEEANTKEGWVETYISQATNEKTN